MSVQMLTNQYSEKKIIGRRVFHATSFTTVYEKLLKVKESHAKKNLEHRGGVFCDEKNVTIVCMFEVKSLSG